MNLVFFRRFSWFLQTKFWPTTWISKKCRKSDRKKKTMHFPHFLPRSNHHKTTPHPHQKEDECLPWSSPCPPNKNNCQSIRWMIPWVEDEKKTVSRSVLSLPRSLTLYIFIYLVYSNLHWYIYIYKFTQVTNPNSVFIAMSLCRRRFVYSQNTKCKTVKPYMFHPFQLPSFVGWIPPAPWFECLGIKNTCYIHLKSNTATHRNE